MHSYKSFETKRLHLRPTMEADAEFILELVNSPKFLQFVGDRGIHSVGNARKYIRDKMLPQLEKLGYANYTVITKKEQTKIGTCGLYQRETVNGIDIGFAFLPDFENQGYGFEAANEILKAGFNDFGIQKIHAYTSKENLSSQKLLSKLGFLQSGTVYLPNDNEELLAYIIENN